MPSENMVIPLMVFLRLIKKFDQMTDSQRQFIEFWYWASTFANRYSAASNEVIIADCRALTSVAMNEKISSVGYFTRLRPLIAAPADLYSYAKRTSAIYRGLLNLICREAGALVDWSSQQKVTVNSTQLDDHHIFPIAFLKENIGKLDLPAGDAEAFIDCVVNRTLIPKILNIKIGKKSPSEYLGALQKTNSNLPACLACHLVPERLIDQSKYDLEFKVFLDERAKRIFDLVQKYAHDPATVMISRYQGSAS